MQEDKLQILLLPPPPSDFTEYAFEAAYKPSLTQALVCAAKHQNAVLDIAVLCSDWDDDGTVGPRSMIYVRCQSLIAAIYKLCCHICSEQGIDPTREGYVDYKVLLIIDAEPTGLSTAVKQSHGPLFSLQTLASAVRLWQIVYCTETEAGEAFLQKFICIRRSLASKPHIRSFDIIRVQGGTSMKVRSLPAGAYHGASHSKQHYTVAVGGTFDNLHEGHKLLLSATALVVEPGKGVTPPQRRLIVGITGDQLLKNKKYAEMLESWVERQRTVFRFLRDILTLHLHESVVEQTEALTDEGPNGKKVLYHVTGDLTIECVEIQEPFGPTITDETISALVISEETRSGGSAINKQRTARGWAPLEVFEVDVLGPSGLSDLSDKISSTERRRRRLEALSARPEA